MEPFIQKGGLRIGDNFWLAGNYTWPFARLTCTNETIEIVLTIPLFSKPYIFSHDTIRQLRIQRGLFSKGLRIEHAVADCAPFILFWSFKVAELTNELERRGFYVLKT
jgi:hypothetical protein